MTKEKITIYPNRARVKGNLIDSNFGNSKSGWHFENYHVDVTYNGRATVRSIKLNQYKMTPKGEPCKLLLTTGAITRIKTSADIVSITATLTNKDNEPIVEQEIRINEGNTLLDQQVTNKNGQIGYEFTSTKGGTHTLRFYTINQNGYSPTSASININVLLSTTLTLEPREYSTTHGAKAPLVLKLRDENNKPIRGQHIEISESDRLLNTDTYTTDINGNMTYPYYEATDNGSQTKITAKIPPLREYHESYITGNVIVTKNNNKVDDGVIHLYMDYDPTPFSSSDVIDGTFSLPYTPEDRKKHKIHIVYRGVLVTDDNGIVSNTKYEPTMLIDNIQAVAAPRVVINTSSSSRYLGELLRVVVNVRDIDNPSYNWKGGNVRIYERLATGIVLDTTGANKWTLCNNKVYSLDSMGNISFNLTHNVRNGLYQYKAVFIGNKNYASGDSAETQQYPEVNWVNRPVTLTITADGSMEYNQKYNISAIMMTGKTRVPNATIVFYLDKEQASNRIGSAVTNSSGIATVSFKPTNVGKHTIIAKFTKGLTQYETKTMTRTVTVTKVTRIITFKSPANILSINSNFNIIGVVTSHGVPVKNATVKLTGSTGCNLNTSVKTNNNGVFTTTYNQKTVGKYTITARIEEDNTYSTTTKSLVFNATALKIPTIQFNSLNCLIGRTYTLNANVPKDATGTFSFILKRSDGTTKTIVNGLTQKNGVISYTTNWKGYVKGRYQYTVHYNGDGNYTQYITGYKSLNLVGIFDIQVDNIVGQTVTSSVDQLIEFSGNVTGVYGEDYNGSLILYIGTSSTPANQKALTIPVTDGGFGGSQATFDTSTTTFNLVPGKYNAMFKCIDKTWDIVTEYNFILQIQSSDIGVLDITNVHISKGNALSLQTIVPAKSDGTIRFIRTDSGGKYISTIGDVNVSKISANKDNKTKTVKIQSDAFKKFNVGVYYYQVQFIGDSYTQTTSSNIGRIYVHQKAVITVGNHRGFAGQTLDVPVKVTDSLGKAYTGTIKVNNGSTTDTVEINNGSGTYYVPKSLRTYSNNDNSTKLTWKYTDTTSSNYNATAISYTYEIPQNMKAIFISKASNFSESMITQFTNMGITDLFIYANQEENSQTLLSNVITALNNKKVRAKFRVHVVINILKNISTGSWYTISHQADTGRINVVNKYIDQLCKKYSFEGICLDTMRLANKDYASTNEKGVTTVLKGITNHIRSTNPRKIISSCMVFDTANARGTYGQNYNTFGQYNDYIIPMLYIYDAKDTSNSTVPAVSLNWLQDTYTTIRNLTNRDNVLPAITTYCGEYTYKNTTKIRRLLTANEYKYQLHALFLYCIRGVALFRAGLIPSGVASYSQITDVSNTNTNVNSTVSLVTTTISKTTANTTGIGIKLRDIQGGYVKGGSCGLKIDGKTLTLKNGTTTIDYNNTSTFNIPVNLATFSNGSHTLTVIYVTKPKYKINSVRKTFNITLKT